MDFSLLSICEAIFFVCVCVGGKVRFLYEQREYKNYQEKWMNIWLIFSGCAWKVTGDKYRRWSLNGSQNSKKNIFLKERYCQISNIYGAELISPTPNCGCIGIKLLHLVLPLENG